MADDTEKPTDKKEEIDAVAESHAGEVVGSLDRNRGLILVGLIVVAVAICAVLVIKQMKTQAHIEAGKAYSTAAAAGDIAALDGVVVNHAGSTAAGNALLTKAEVQIDQGKSADAMATLETFVADYGSHPRHAQGLFGIANLHQVSGDAAKAQEFYEKTISEQPDGELTPLCRIRLGDLALAAGDTEKAEQHYQESFTLHPGTPFYELSQEKIQRLTVGNPPVVDPPKPEPEPEPKPEPEATTPEAVTPKPEPAAETPAPGAETPAPAGKTKAPAKEKAKAPSKEKGKGKAKTDQPKGKGKGKAKAAPQEPATPAKGGQKAKQKAAPENTPAPAPENAPAPAPAPAPENAPAPGE